MKTARFVLKIVGAALAAAAFVCCVIAYWDKITDCIEAVAEKFGRQRVKWSSEYEDYADWEDV